MLDESQIIIAAGAEITFALAISINPALATNKKPLSTSKGWSYEQARQACIKAGYSGRQLQVCADRAFTLHR